MQNKRIRMMYIGTLVNNLQDAMDVIFQAAKNNNIEVFWAANFSGYKGDIRDIPCHVLQVDFTRHPVLSRNNIQAIKQLRKYIREYKIQFVHCNTPIGSFCARIAAKLEHIHCVLYTAHGLPFYNGAPFKANLFKFLEYRMARITDCAVVMNQEDYHSFEKMHLRKGKIYKIDGVGIPIRKRTAGIREQKRKELGIPDDIPVIICVGRLEKLKGYPISIEAFSRTQDKKAQMIICGMGHEEESLKELVLDLHCEDRIKFLGFRNDVFELMQASDIYLLTSYYEGLPRSVMEAMNANIACIVSDARGNIDLIQNQKNGLVVQRSSVEQTVNALDVLMKDCALRERLSKQASNDVMKYKASNIVEQYSKIYHDVISMCIIDGAINDK